MWYSRNRDRIWRFASVALAVAILWPVLKSMIAESLVARAQPYLVYGMPATGMRYLDRALALDPSNLDALEERDFGNSFAHNRAELALILQQVKRDALAHPDDLFLWRQLLIVAMRNHQTTLAQAAAMHVYAIEPNRTLALTIKALHDHPR